MASRKEFPGLQRPRWLEPARAVNARNRFEKGAVEVAWGSSEQYESTARVVS
jgi:hypothetical protein